MSIRVLVLSSAFAVALTACAPMEGGDDMAMASVSPASCFTTGDVDNFRVESDSQAVVHSRRRAVFRLDGAANCFTSDTTRVAVEPYLSASERMCPGDRVSVQVQTGSLMPKTCLATVSGPVSDSTLAS